MADESNDRPASPRLAEQVPPATARGEASRPLPLSIASLINDIELYGRVLDSMRDGVHIVDPEGTILGMNHRCAELFGYEAHELIGRHISVLNAPTDYSPMEVAERILATLAAEGAWHGELPNLRKDGTVVWTTASVTTYAHPTLGLLWITVQGSIDARRAAEDALRRYAETLDALHRIQSRVIRDPGAWPLADVLATLAAALPVRRALVVEASRPGDTHAEPSPSLAGAQGLRVLARFADPAQVDPAQAGRVAQRWPPASIVRAVIETGRADEATVAAAAHHVRWRVLPLFSAGVAVGALCIAYGPARLPPDSERLVDLVASTAGNLMAARRAQLDRRRFAEERARLAALSAVGTLAGGVAHDFNNILQGISMTNEVMDLDRHDPACVAEGAADVRRLTQRAGRLVRDLLTFSRPRDATFEMIDLGQTFDGALRILRSCLPRSIGLEARLDGLVGVPLFGNDAQLEQVLVNLGTNAAHAIGGAQGRISFSGAVVPVAEGSGRVEGAGTHAVRIEVEDDGCGMDEATIARAFEPFFTTKEVGQGTGLGLAMVRSIVEAHGGSIEVRSRPGAGCCMTLWLPPAVGAAVHRPTPLAPCSGELSILLVDDEVDIARRLAGALGRLGFTVAPFDNPLAAARALEARPHAFDLLITDRTMPGMTGEALVERVRAVRPALPVLMASGGAARIDPEVIARLGISRVVEKPVDLAQLTRIIVEVLESETARARVSDRHAAS